ncbi:MAG: hypothetical protein U1F24_03885 [Alphaproteobacteria bacterium]
MVQFADSAISRALLISASAALRTLTSRETVMIVDAPGQRVADRTADGFDPQDAAVLVLHPHGDRLGRAGAQQFAVRAGEIWRSSSWMIFTKGDPACPAAS